MSPRLAPILAVVAIAVAACTGSAAPASSDRVARATSQPGPTATASPSAATPAPTASVDAGNVGDVSGPELTIEPVSGTTIRVTLADPAAKAWRIAVAGTGDRIGDRWVLQVATGDVGPDITTTETLNGLELPPVVRDGLGTGGATGRICATSVAVCLRAASVVLPEDGNGTLVLELSRTDLTDALSVTGATATWTTDPFVLGPWTATEAFPWAS